MRWALIIVVAAILVAAAFLIDPRDWRPKVPVQLGTITFLGDSLTAGHGLKPEQAYPSLLQIPGMTMLNMGVSGDKTGDGLKRLMAYFEGGGKPQLVVLALGANDIAQNDPPGQIEANLQSAIQECKSRNIPVLLCGVRIPGKLAADKIFVRLAKKNDLPMMRDLMQGQYFHRSTIQPDNVHPNAEGQKLMAKAMQRALLRYFSFGPQPPQH